MLKIITKLKFERFSGVTGSRNFFITFTLASLSADVLLMLR